MINNEDNILNEKEIFLSMPEQSPIVRQMSDSHTPPQYSLVIAEALRRVNYPLYTSIVNNVDIFKDTLPNQNEIEVFGSNVFDFAVDQVFSIMDNAFPSEDMQIRSRILFESQNEIEDETEALKLQEQEQEELSLSFIKELKLNDEKELNEIQYKCCMCLDTHLLVDMISLSCQPTGHKFCQDCFQGYCTSKINDNEITEQSLKCPIPECNTAITYDEIKANVTSETFYKFELFGIKNFSEQSNFLTCPKCNEWCVDMSLEEESKYLWKSVLCGKPDCNHKFCGKCKNPPHIEQVDQNITCAEYETWLKQNSNADDSMEDYKKRPGFNICPDCKNGVDLASGCKFMTCKCKTKFCMICGVKLKEINHTKHYYGKGCTGPFGDTCLGPLDPMIVKD
jgi:hypothetical protein